MGGSWDGNENKIIPDVYQRYSSQSSLVMQPSTRGIVTIAKDLNWGPVGVVQTIDAGEDMTPYTGYDATDASNRWVQEMLKGTNRTSAPYRILLYRLNGTGGVEATATTGQLTATAKYPGTRGNDITIVVTDLTDPEGSFDVSTVIDGRIVDSQIVETIDQLAANDWVTFSGTGAPTSTVGAPLSGGANPTSGASDWSDYAEAIEPYRFDAMVYDGTDATVRTALLNFIRRYFDDNGRQAQLVASGLTNPDSRWVVNVMSGVVLSDGTTLTPQQVCWWAGGALAGAQYNQDLTGASYPDAVQVTPKLKRSDLEAGIQAANANFVIAKAGMSEESLRVAFMAPRQEVYLETSTRNVMSVDIPVFEYKTRTADSNDIYSYGYAFTSGDLDAAVKSLADILPDMLLLAEREKACQLMAAEIEKTRRRVNALEHVIIPEAQQNIKYITMKLDENERSTQIRLMKVKDMMLEEAHHYKEKQQAYS